MRANLNREEEFKVENKDLCPCGSGKEFNLCCKNKKYKYHTLGKNFNGDTIVYNQTKNMELYDEITEYAVEKIFIHNGEGALMVSKGTEMLKDLYEKIDRGIKPFEKYASCKKGCGSCCSLYLECTPVEAELIRRYIISTRSTEEIEKLNKLVKEKGRVLNPPKNSHTLTEEEKRAQWLSYAEKNEKCIFLNEENACSIYEVRPLSCRKFIVFSDSEKCSVAEEIVTPNLAPANIGRLSIDYLSLAITRYSKLSYINEKGEKAPVMRCLIEWMKDGFKDINKEL